MEKKRKSKIRKWDEVGGMVEEEVVENTSTPDETSNPVISRDQNSLKSVEDAVEQNDNSLDGIINNMPEVKPAAQMTSEDVIKEEQKKKSIRKALKELTPEQEKAKPIPHVIIGSERERI